MVAERTSGITEADRAYLGGIAYPGKASPVIPSRQDDQAAQVVVAIDAAEPADAVADLRAALDNPPAGLTVLVTGPAAQIADLKEDFGGIDGLLLLVAGAVAQSDVFLADVESTVGQEVLSRHFPSVSGSPAIVLARAGAAEEVFAAAKADGVSTVERRGSVDGSVRLDVVLKDPADCEAALETVQRLRSAVREVPAAEAKVGGPTATQLDTRDTSERDRLVIIPIVLLVIFLVLALLLRSLVAPLLLIATVALSFGATMGVSALVFNGVFDFPGADPVVPLFGFVFLVALGIDYNIFLMTRVREETRVLGRRGRVCCAG